MTTRDPFFRIMLGLSAVLTFLLFATAVFAQAAPVPNPDDTSVFLMQVFAAIQGGNWRVLAILVAVGLVWALRKFAIKIPGAVGVFFATNRGGAVMALVGGAVTALAGALYSGTVGLPTLIDALVLGVSAAGGWTLVRRIIWNLPPPPPEPVAPPK